MKRTILYLSFIVILSLFATACGATSAPEPTVTPTVTAPTMTPPVEVSSDVVYVTPLQPDVTEQRLDIYTPRETGNWPVVVFLHGYDGTKEWYAPLSQAIAEQGAVVFTAAWPTWITDLAARENGKGFREMSEVLSCAIRFARATAADYGGDPSQVTLVGHSHGADAGAWVALAGDNFDRSWEESASIRGGPPPQVECVVSGVSANVDAFVGIGGSYDDFTGPLQERDPELWQIADPYAHLGQNLDLQVRLIHGERDNLVMPEHTVQFNDALAEAGYDTSLTLWDGTHRVPTELTVAEVMEVAGEPVITPEIAELEPADKPEVVNSFDASRSELPEGIAIDKAGNIYVSLGPPLFVGGGFGEIWKISPDGAETMLAQFDGGPPAAGLAVDASSNLYYAYPVDEGDDRGGVYRLTEDGSTERLPGTENIILPNGLAFDNDANLYVSDSILGAIWRIPPGRSAELWLQHELLAGCLPDDPFGANGVALWEGTLYAANTGKGILVSVPILADGSAGEPEMVAGAGDCDAKVKDLYGMDGIALDVDGNVYALLVLQNKLVKIDPADGSFTTLLTEENGLHNPASITFGIGEDNQSILFTNYAVLPPEPAASPGPAVLKFDVGMPGEPAITPEIAEMEPADGGTNIMENQVQYMVEWTVNEGALDTVKQMVAESVESVEANEPKMMAFHWYVNEEQSKFYLLEWFEDADAIVDHFDNIGESLGELLNYAQITRYEVYGDLTDDAEKAVTALGADKFVHYSGFTRQNEQMQDNGHRGNQVQYIVEWSVNEGALDTVKQMAAESVESVEANEPKMMAFHWYVNEEQNKFYLVEWFEDADAIVDHFDNIGESLGELLNYAQIARYEVFGDLTEEARQAVESLEAQTLGHWDGFTR